MVLGLTSWCNNLDLLVLSGCRGMERLRICSTTMKELLLIDGEGSLLEICCPNLCALLILNFKMKMYCIEDSASLVEAEAQLKVWNDYELSDELEWWSNLLRELTSVKQLVTQNYFFELLCEKKAFLGGCVFENLNNLELATGYKHSELLGMAALLEICPNITTLTLKYCSILTVYNGQVPRLLVDKPIEFNIPNLKILNLKYSKRARIEELLMLMMKHGAALEKIVLLDRNSEGALEKIVLWDQNSKREIFNSNPRFSSVFNMFFNTGFRD